MGVLYPYSLLGFDFDYDTCAVLSIDLDVLSRQMNLRMTSVTETRNAFCDPSLLNLCAMMVSLLTYQMNFSGAKSID